MKLAIGVNLFGDSPADQLCRRTLIRYATAFPGTVALYNLQPHDKALQCTYEPEFTLLPCARTVCRDVIPGSTKLKPVVSEMLDGLAGTGAESFMIINSDILVSPEALGLALSCRDYDALAMSRVNIGLTAANNGIKDASFQREYPNGFDGFWIRTEFWKRCRPFMTGIPDVYAERAWDNSYAILFKLLGRCRFMNKWPVIFHFPHPVRWGPDTLEGKWCGRLWDMSGLESLWVEYNAKVLMVREYDGQGMVKNIAAEERLESSIFTVENWERHRQRRKAK